MNSMEKEIVFFDEIGVPFDGSSIEKIPIGGSETAIINVAREFAKNGYNVTAYNNCKEEGIFGKVQYKKNTAFEKDSKKGFGIFVAQRALGVFLKNFKAKKKILWMQDNPSGAAYSKELSQKLKNALPNIDNFFAISNFQKKELLKNFNFVDENKIFLTRNGVDNELIDGFKENKKDKNKFVYTTTPFRGLLVLLEIWPQIKKALPASELHVFGGMKVYQKQEGIWEKVYDKAAVTEGVFVHGALAQKDLFREMSDAYLYLYPNTFDETGCISAMESISLGIPVISSNKGALPETIRPDCGVLIDGNPEEKDYRQKFAQAAIDASRDETVWKKMHERSLKQDYSWKTIAKEWMEFFES